MNCCLFFKAIYKGEVGDGAQFLTSSNVDGFVNGVGLNKLLISSFANVPFQWKLGKEWRRDNGYCTSERPNKITTICLNDIILSLYNWFRIVLVKHFDTYTWPFNQKSIIISLAPARSALKNYLWLPLFEFVRLVSISWIKYAHPYSEFLQT